MGRGRGSGNKGSGRAMSAPSLVRGWGGNSPRSSVGGSKVFWVCRSKKKGWGEGANLRHAAWWRGTKPEGNADSPFIHEMLVVSSRFVC